MARVEIDEVVADVFRITIPTPFPHEPSSHAYLIRDETVALVDAGVGHGSSGPAVTEALRRAGLPGVALILNTHEHADHAGGDVEAAPDARIRMHPVAVESVRKQAAYRPPPEVWEKMDAPMRAVFETGVRQFEELSRRPVEVLAEGDEVSLGAHRLRIIHTPGHAPGHVCFYEPRRRLLFTGDHVLGHGTPYVGVGEPLTGDMGAYLASLERLETLEADLLLPGHGPVVDRPRARIAETRSSKLRRERRVLEALQSRGEADLKTVSRIAYTDVRGLPGAFLMSSTGAYLAKLVAEGRVLRQEREGRVLYALA